MNIAKFLRRTFWNNICFRSISNTQPFIWTTKMEESLKYQISRDNLWREILPPQESSAKYTTFMKTIIAINVRNFILKLCMERNAQFLVLCNNPKSGASWSYTSFPNTKKNYHRLISLITVILSFLIKKFLRKFDIHLFFLFFFFIFFFIFFYFIFLSTFQKICELSKIQSLFFPQILWKIIFFR